VSRHFFLGWIVLAAAIGLPPVPPQAARNESAPSTLPLQSPQAPGNQSPLNQSEGQPQDPAAVLFATEVGMVLHAVKPGSTADYELAIVTLKDALAKAEEPQTQQLARAWRIFKATEADAKSNVLYVHLLDPAQTGIDYRPSLWLDKLLAGAPADLLAKYRDAFAVAPTKLSLTDVTKLAEIKKQ
jgi:hypothetical protein